MAEEIWSYLHNPFDNVTKRSFTLMNLLATDHHDKLKQKASIDTRFAPLYQDFVGAYQKFKDLLIAGNSNAGRYQSRTKRVEDLFAELASTLARKWDVRVQVEYDENTSEYVSIFPSGRKPFQSGSYEARVNEVKALYERLLHHSNLANLAADVKLFASNLEEARTAQQGFEQTERELSLGLEAARTELAKAMYGVFVRLKYLHLDELKMVETYYELKYLRRGSSGKPDDIPLTDAEVVEDFSA